MHDVPKSTIQVGYAAMKYNDVPMTEQDVQIMIAFLQTFWNLNLDTNAAKELLFALRQTLFMQAISAPGDLKKGMRLQVESLEAVLKDVTFDATKLKLYKQP